MTQTEPTHTKPTRTGPTAPNDGTHALTKALSGYVKRVAVAVGVPVDGTTCEVTDTATAYLALGTRGTAHPDRDVMLVWSATQGWTVSIETSPAESPIVLARFTGDLVPEPDAVARFVTESLARPGGTPVPASAAPTPAPDLADLAARMNRLSR